MAEHEMGAGTDCKGIAGFHRTRPSRMALRTNPPIARPSSFLGAGFRRLRAGGAEIMAVAAGGFTPLQQTRRWTAYRHHYLSTLAI